MALQTSGAISLSDIQGEFGGSNPISLSEYYRGGAYTTNNNTNVATSGAISIGSFYGAVSTLYLTISSNAANLNLQTLATNNGWSSGQPLDVTINSNVWLYSNTTSTAGLIIPSALSNVLTLRNYGKVIGMGGNGGNAGGNATAGGPAISNSATGVTVVNYSGAYIAGGGGGGGSFSYGGGGGGAGGGRGGNSNGRHATMQGGAGNLSLGGTGSHGQSWGAPYTDYNYCGSDGGSGDPRGLGGSAGGGGATAIDTGSSCGFYGGAGGGGGRALPGVGGTGGDRSGPYRSASTEGGEGGSGGNAGQNGIGAYGQEDGAGGGGGWGASGGTAVGSGARGGAAGGAAISGNAVTLTNYGTVYGST